MLTHTHTGLEGLIGSPMMIDGSLLNTMKAEHCDQADAMEPFNTSNGIEGVTSKMEWEFVVQPDTTATEPGSMYKERGGDFIATHREWCRVPTALTVYEEKMEEKNVELEEQGQTPLIREELVAGRLYTGPM